MTATRRKPVLTRKHFELIARKISESPGGNLRGRIASTLAPVFKELNPSFNEEIFAAQCQGNFSRRVTRRVRNRPEPPQSFREVLPEEIGPLFRVGIVADEWRILDGEGQRAITLTEQDHVQLDAPDAFLGYLPMRHVERWVVERSSTGSWLYRRDASVVSTMLRVHTDGEGINYVREPHPNWEWIPQTSAMEPPLTSSGLLSGYPVRYVGGRWVFEGYQRDRVLTSMEVEHIIRDGTDYFRGRMEPRHLDRFAVNDISSISGMRTHTYDHSIIPSDVPILIDESGVPYTMIPPASWTAEYGVRE